MKKLQKIYFILLLTLGFGMLTTSCHNEDEVDQKYISVAEEQTKLFANKHGFTYRGDNVSFVVESNTFWLIHPTAEDEWLKFSSLTGNLTGSVTIEMQENRGETRRSTFWIENKEGMRIDMSIVQAGVEEKISYFGSGFGAGVSNTAISAFDKWDSQGVGCARVQFDGTGAVVDGSAVSSGYENASAGNNIFLKDAKAEFVVAGIEIKSETNFALTFGAVANAGRAAADELKVFISQDMENWTRVRYDATIGNTWSLVRIPFFIRGGVEQFYIKFASENGGVYRIDDIALSEGYGDGNNVIFVEDDISYVDYDVFRDDFSWIDGGSGGTGPDAFPGGDGGNITGNPTGTFGWDITACYRRIGFAKIGATNSAGKMVSPKLSTLEATPSEVMLKFDAAYVFTSDFDEVRITVLNAGTINGEESTVFNIGTVNKWTPFEFTIVGATSQTQIAIGAAYTNDEQKAAGKSNRFLFDNFLITRRESKRPDDPLKITVSESKLEYMKAGGTKSVKIESNKEWVIQNTPSWATVTPISGGASGAGTTYVNIAAQPMNDGDQPRTQTLNVMVEGEVAATIVLSQEPIVPKVATPANLTLADASPTAVTVTWDGEVATTDKYVVEIRDSADDSATPVYSYNLDVAAKFSRYTGFSFSNLNANTNYWVRIKRLSTSAEFADSDYAKLAVKTKAKPVFGPEVVFYQPFDNNFWSGDLILNSYGVSPAVTDKNAMPLDKMVNVVDPSKGGSSDMINTMNATYKEHRGMVGWTGTRVYEYLGFAKLGTSSAFGWIQTPKMDGLTSASSKVRLTFRIAPWFDTAGAGTSVTVDPATVKLTIVGGGSTSGATTFENRVEYTWKSFSVDVEGATSDTQFKFEGTSSTAKGRFCIDDIKVTVIQ